MKKNEKETAPTCQNIDYSDFLSQLPYRLTNGQNQAVSEILADMCRPGKEGFTVPMSRILIGDVGCGKTVCAAIAL